MEKRGLNLNGLKFDWDIVQRILNCVAAGQTFSSSLKKPINFLREWPEKAERTDEMGRQGKWKRKGWRLLGRRMDWLDWMAQNIERAFCLCFCSHPKPI
jgi:hypothetical protein